MGRLMGIIWKQIREMAGENLESGYVIHRAVLRFLGLSWWNQTIFTRLYSAGIFVFCSVHFYSAWNYIRNARVDSDEEFKHAMIDLVGTIAFSSAFLKHVLMLVLNKKLARLIYYMERELPPDGILLPGFNLYATFSAQVTSTAGVWSMSGIILKDPRLRGLLWGCDFPWDDSSHLGHLAALQWQAIIAWLCFLQHVVLDTLPVVTVYKLRVHIKNIKEMLSKVGTNPDNDTTIVREAVTLHNYVLKGVRMLNSTYEFVLLYQMCYMVFHGCIIVFSVSMVKVDDPSFGRLIVIMISAYLQLYVYCRSGQILNSEMEGLYFSCYDSKWYSSSKGVRMSILNIMTVAGMTVRFESFGISAALYTSYLASARESYSYFLFLRTLSSKMEG